MSLMMVSASGALAARKGDMGGAGNSWGGRASPIGQLRGRPNIGSPRRRVWSATAVASAVYLCAAVASAETMRSALVKAYQNNPQLNAQRANARSIDENVPQALSGYRPKFGHNGKHRRGICKSDQ